MLPTTCSLPAHALLDSFDVQIVSSLDCRRQLLEEFSPSDDKSFYDGVLDRVRDTLPEQDMDLLPYIIQKMWIGDKLVYIDGIESRLKVYL